MSIIMMGTIFLIISTMSIITIGIVHHSYHNARHHQHIIYHVEPTVPYQPPLNCTWVGSLAGLLVAGALAMEGGVVASLLLGPLLGEEVPQPNLNPKVLLSKNSKFWPRQNYF
jgi:hypothetical protein